MNRIIFLLALFAMAPYPAVAAIEWAEWGAPVGNSVAGTFGGGQTVTLVGNFTGITHGIAAGVEYTSSPPVPGRPDNTNPPFMKINTGTPGTAICVDNGVVVCPPYPMAATLDLSGLPAGASVTLGLGDHKYGFSYALEFRDSNLAILPWTDADVTVTATYNINYNNDLFPPEHNNVADYNSILYNGVLYVDGTHDAGGIYTHTGLTTISNLPAGTRHIHLYFPGPGVQDVEAIHIYLGADLSSTTEIPSNKVMPWLPILVE